MKQCARCKQWKDSIDFGRDKSKKDGLGSYCKECIRNKARELYSNNIDKMREKNRKYRAENYEKRSRIDKKYFSTHKEKMREKGRRWYTANREKAKKILSRWLSVNPENKRAFWVNRRARENGNGGKIKAKDWIALCEKYGGKCLRCGRSDLKLTLDHVLPLSMGGSNTIDNAQPLCLSCNSSKGVKHIDYRPLSVAMDGQKCEAAK